MSNVYEITVIINITILCIAVITACIYILPIIFVRRFHTTNNILTGNVCVTGIICPIFWIFANVMQSFYTQLLFENIALCSSVSYFSILVNSLMVYSFTVVTINRYVTILYPTKAFFKRQIWAFISIAVHWFGCFLISIPILIHSIGVRMNLLDCNHTPVFH